MEPYDFFVCVSGCFCSHYIHEIHSYCCICSRFFFPLLCVIPLYSVIIIYSFYFDAYLGYFKFWAIMDKASMNILVNMFYKCSVLGGVNHKWNCCVIVYTISQSNSTNLHSHYCMRVYTVAPHPPFMIFWNFQSF